MPTFKETATNKDRVLQLLQEGFTFIGDLPNEPEPEWKTLHQPKTAKHKIGFLVSRDNEYFICQYDFLREQGPIKFNADLEPEDKQGFSKIKNENYSYVLVHTHASKEHPFEKKILVLKGNAKLPGHKFLAGPYFDSATGKKTKLAKKLRGGEIHFDTMMINPKSSNLKKTITKIQPDFMELFEEGALSPQNFCDDITDEEVEKSKQSKTPRSLERKLSFPRVASSTRLNLLSPSSPLHTGRSLSLPSPNHSNNELSVPMVIPMSGSRSLPQQDAGSPVGSPTSSPLIPHRALTTTRSSSIFDFKRSPSAETEECTVKQLDEAFQQLLSGSFDEILSILEKSKHPADILLQLHKRARKQGRLDLLDHIYARFQPPSENKDEAPPTNVTSQPSLQPSFFPPADPLLTFIEKPSQDCNPIELEKGILLLSAVLEHRPDVVLNMIQSPERKKPALELILDLEKKIQMQHQTKPMDDCDSSIGILNRFRDDLLKSSYVC